MKVGSGLTLAAIAAVVMTLATTGAWAASMALVPHRATYDMALASTKPGSGIVGASGSMSYEFADACDGWIVENRIAISYAYSEGGQAMTTTDFVTWESKDGLRYRFRLRNTRDGQVTDEVEGTAQLKGKGLGGVARYTRPEAMTVSLPKGTLFPTEHTRRLIADAHAGGKSLLRVVFDGSDTEGPYDVSAWIGRPHIVEANVASQLLDTPSWPMRLAYYPVKGEESTPDFEMGLDYHANGIAQNILQSFKDFSLVGKLRSLKALPHHRC